MKKINKKVISLKFRVTQNEKDIIKDRAKNVNKTFSDFARFMLINGEIIVLSQKDKSILAGLANNINQLTKLFHQTKQVPHELLSELQIILIHLKNAYRRNS